MLMPVGWLPATLTYTISKPQKPGYPSLMYAKPVNLGLKKNTSDLHSLRVSAICTVSLDNLIVLMCFYDVCL